MPNKSITFFPDTGQNFGGITRAAGLFKELGIEVDEEHPWRWHFHDFQESLVLHIIDDNQIDFSYIIDGE